MANITEPRLLATSRVQSQCVIHEPFLISPTDLPYLCSYQIEASFMSICSSPSPVRPADYSPLVAPLDYPDSADAISTNTQQPRHIWQTKLNNLLSSELSRRDNSSSTSNNERSPSPQTITSHPSPTILPSGSSDTPPNGDVSLVTSQKNTATLDSILLDGNSQPEQAAMTTMGGQTSPSPIEQSIEVDETHFGREPSADDLLAGLGARSDVAWNEMAPIRRAGRPCMDGKSRVLKDVRVRVRRRTKDVRRRAESLTKEMEKQKSNKEEDTVMAMELDKMTMI